MEPVIYERQDGTVTKTTGLETGNLLVEQFNVETGYTNSITFTPKELLRFISDAPAVSQSNTPEVMV